MAQRNYCTLFDRNYLLKGVVMLRSIARHSPDARVYVLCMDEMTQDLLTRLAIPGVVTMLLADVETPDVLAAKKTRSIAEYRRAIAETARVTRRHVCSTAHRSCTLCRRSSSPSRPMA